MNDDRRVKSPREIHDAVVAERLPALREGRDRVKKLDAPIPRGDSEPGQSAPGQLPAAVRADAQRILDRAARRVLGERLDGEKSAARGEGREPSATPPASS
jgi:hypothetical protein